MLDWVIILWDDWNDYGGAVTYDWSKKDGQEFWLGSSLNGWMISILKDFIDKCEWQSWTLGSYHWSKDFEYNFESQFACYLCEEKWLLYRNVYSSRQIIEVNMFYLMVFMLKWNYNDLIKNFLIFYDQLIFEILWN